jgi:hypothetical protein
MAPSLLNLPQELRDFIIEYALISSGTAPDKPDKERGREEYEDIAYISRIKGRGIFYEKRRHHTSAYALLLVNHQIHNETKAALERHSSGGNKYDMDIMLVNEEFLYPTWTSVPPLVRKVDAFSVTFRIVGVANSTTNGFMDEEGSTGATIWRLYSVLERFMRCGAALSRSTMEDRRLRLKLLDINVLTPPSDSETSPLAPEDVKPDKLPTHRKENAPHDQTMHPAALAKFIYIWVEGILRLSDPSYALPGTPIAKYSKLFFDRVSNFKISVDGEEKYYIDVGEMAREIAEKNKWFK